MKILKRLVDKANSHLYLIGFVLDFWFQKACNLIAFFRNTNVSINNQLIGVSAGGTINV